MALQVKSIDKIAEEMLIWKVKEEGDLPCCRLKMQNYSQKVLKFYYIKNILLIKEKAQK